LLPAFFDHRSAAPMVRQNLQQYNLQNRSLLPAFFVVTLAQNKTVGVTQIMQVRKPFGYWKDHKNQKEFLESLATKLNILTKIFRDCLQEERSKNWMIG
jgi:hypothetical protein